MKKEEYEKQLFTRIDEAMTRRGVDKISESVILCGSFGRGEPTYAVCGEDVVLKSDVEIAVAYTCSKKRVMRFIAEVSSEFEEELNLMSIKLRRIKTASNFNNTLFPQKYKTLFTYDLFNGSRTIRGRDFISEKSITLDEVDLFEARRIIANRIGELIHARGTDSEKIWKGKVLLAIASAFLLKNGKYSSSYHAQYAEIEKNQSDAENFAGSGFFEKYKEAFLFLRENGEDFDIEYDALRTFCHNAATGLSNCADIPRVNSFSRKLKYALKYVRCTHRFDFYGIERKIINDLIKQFSENDKLLDKTAQLWYNILY